MRGKVLAVWWLTCVLWSSVWVFIKIGVTDLPPMSLAGLRLAIALLVLAPVVWARRRDLPRTRREWLWIAGTGFLLLGINYALVFWGTQFIASGLTAVLQAMTPAFGLLFAHWITGARAGAGQMIGVAIGVAGVAAVSANQLQVSGMPALIGSIAVSAGGACVALTYIYVKKQLAHVAPLMILFGQMIFGCVPLLVAGFLVEGNPLGFAWTTRSVVAMVYLAIAGSVAAFWLNLWLLRHSDASSILAMSIVEPLLAVAAGALVLHERFPPLAWAGGALIMLSIWLVVVRKTTSDAAA